MVSTITLRRSFFVIFLAVSSFVEKTKCAAPRTSGFPTTANVGEKEYKTRLVKNMGVTDVNNDNFICDVDSSTEEVKAYFRVLREPITGEYGVYAYNPDPGTAGAPNVLFNYANNKTFSINLLCTDGNNEFSISNIRIDVIQNDRLQFTNLPTSIKKSASAVVTGEKIFTVQSSDLLGHTPITYTMTASPDTGRFALDSSSGILTAKSDLKHEIHTPIDFLVTVSDGIMNVYDKLRLDLENMNKIPVLRNVPATLNIIETMASGSTIVTLTAVDLDVSDSLSYTMNVDPVTDSSLFTLDTTNDRAPELKLSTGRNFDYEQANKVYNITILVSDSKTSTGAYVIIINVINDDEPCFFDKPLYTVQMFEAGILEYSASTNMKVNDHDGPSPYTLSLVPSAQSADFIIDPTSGALNFKVDYNVDGGVKPSTVNLVVQCTDPTSLTGTSSITVNIGDVNDNPPVFTSGSHFFTISQNTVQGSLISTLPVTDADSGTNAQFSCTLDAGIATTTSAFSVSDTCGVYLISSTGLTNGNTYTFAVKATDKGTPTQSSTSYVSIKYQEVTTTTTTTTTTTVATTTVDPLTQPGTLAAIIIGALGGAILLGLLTYFCLRYCFTGACCGPHGCDFMNCCQGGNGQGCCQRQPTRRPTYQKPRRPPTPPTPRSPQRSRSPPRKKKAPLREVREAPRDTAKEFNYMRHDSDFGLINSTNQHSGNNIKTFGQRNYIDYPQAEPTKDVPLDLINSQSRRIIGYSPGAPVTRPAIGYM